LKWVHVIDYLASKPCSTTFAALQAAAGRAARFVTGWSATFAPAGCKNQAVCHAIYLDINATTSSWLAARRVIAKVFGNREIVQLFFYL